MKPSTETEWEDLTVHLRRARGLLVIAASVAVTVVWNEPVLVRVPPIPGIVAALVVIAGCWWRAWRLRDPVRSPVARRRT